MKKVVNIAVGGRSFSVEEDAYYKLKNYLEASRTKSKLGIQSAEVMDSIEERIAELFSEKLTEFRNVVDIDIVNSVISQLGMPDGEAYTDSSQSETYAFAGDLFNGMSPNKKFYRNSLNKSIGGVCGGIAAYLGCDALIFRLLFVITLLFAGTGFWVYIILWIAVPLAETPVQKCEMLGLPVTAENLRKFTNVK